MNRMTMDSIQQFLAYLRQEERSPATLEKYGCALRRFYTWLSENRVVDKPTVISYKNTLLQQYSPSSANGALAAINGFMKFQGWHDCVVKQFRIQRRVFSSPDKELTKAEYLRLVASAERKGEMRLSLLLQLVASTGIRVSEVQYITVEAVRQTQVEIRLKGKVRTILLPGKLCRKLQKYCQTKKISSGSIFRTRSGRAINRKEIWVQMKRLCRTAAVPADKVFPHNLRHLFARVFYSVQRDIAKLADLLGHSSVETTRIYLMSSGTEHRKVLEQLGLIC